MLASAELKVCSYLGIVLILTNVPSRSRALTFLDDNEVDSPDLLPIPFGPDSKQSLPCEGQSSKLSRLPDPTDCFSFIYCVAGTAYPGRCPAKMLFNPETKRCDSPENAKCGNIQNPTLAPTSPYPDTDPMVLPNHLTLQTLPETLLPMAIKTTTTQSQSQLLPGSASSNPTTASPNEPFTSRVHDSFQFQLDCSKNPCGLYPNTDGDCTTFFLCQNGTMVTKHCYGGQLFDLKTQECQLPSKAQCWSLPSNPPVTIPTYPSICPFHAKPPTPTFQTVANGSVLTNPGVTNWGSWQPWTFCVPGTYITGIYVWKRLLQQGDASDLAGVVSLSFNCARPDGAATNFIQSLAPNAPYDGWPSYFTCNGNGVGFQMNSQKDQGPLPKDNVAADNVQLLCSCGPNVYKSYDAVPGPQGGNRGTWTSPQVCGPRQALCGMQTQMADYRERVIGSYDNTGLNNMNMKCCDVPNPATTCKPVEKTVLVNSCTNNQGIYPMKCNYLSSIGVTYDYGKQMSTINFYESIGYAIGNETSYLQANFKSNLGYNKTLFNWSNSNDLVWKLYNDTAKAFYLDSNSKADLYQVVGVCGYFFVETNRYIRNVTDLGSGRGASEVVDL